MSPKSVSTLHLELQPNTRADIAGESDLDLLVRKGYLAPEERGRRRAMKQALEAFLSDRAHAYFESRRARKNINGR
jgi:hypothetical protein